MRKGWCTLVRRLFLIDVDRKGRCSCQYLSEESEVWRDSQTVCCEWESESTCEPETADRDTLRKDTS
jgi:hypothetical protein